MTALRIRQTLQEVLGKGWDIALEAKEARSEAAKAVFVANMKTHTAVEKLTKHAKLPHRDVAMLVGITHQRVSQIAGMNAGMCKAGSRKSSRGKKDTIRPSK